MRRLVGALAMSRITGELSRDHPAALFRAGAADLHAFVHVAELLAVPSALIADLRAFAADMLGMFGAHQHEMG